MEPKEGAKVESCPPPSRAWAFIEGNILERPAVLAPQLPSTGRHRRWVTPDVFVAVMSLYPDTQVWDRWEIRTSLSAVARRLGSTNTGGHKLDRILQALQYLHTTPIHFPKFLVRRSDGTTTTEPKTFTLFKELEYTPEGGRKTIRIRLADEIASNLRNHYGRNIKLSRYVQVRRATRRSQTAVLLYLYLAKKNPAGDPAKNGEWIESAESIHEKLGLDRHRDFYRAQQLLKRAAEVLWAAGELQGFSILEASGGGRERYRFVVGKRPG